MHIRFCSRTFCKSSAAVYGRWSQREDLGDDLRGLLRSSQDLLKLGFQQSSS